MESNACCPNPDYPAIVPDAKATKLRAVLKLLYYGQFLICGTKLLLLGPLAAVF